MKITLTNLLSNSSYIILTYLVFFLWLTPFTVFSQKINYKKKEINNIETKIQDIADDYSKEFLKIEDLSFDDTLNFYQHFQKETNGQINMDYAYGLNTSFRDSSRMIGGYFNTYGGVNTQFKMIPIKVSFNYSSLKIPLGTNNYFRISYDRQKMIQNTEKFRQQQLTSAENQLKGFYNQLGKLSELQSYLDVYINANKEKYINLLKERTVSTINADSFTTNFKSENSGFQNPLDTLSSKIPATNIQSDSIQLSNSFEKVKQQRFMDEFEKVQKLYEKIQTYHNNYQQLVDRLESTKNSLSQKNIPSINQNIGNYKNINLLDAVKKVDLGLTYTNTTALSNQSTAIKGFGTELQINNYYLSISSGLTLNNVMLSTNEMSNQLVYNQNVFNQFDFQRIYRNGLLSAVKTGLGKPTSNHIFVGFNHITNTRFTGGDSSGINPAMGLELDIKLVPKFLKSGALDLVYTKTSINRNIDSSNISMFNSLFSTYNSSSYLVKYSQNVNKINSSFNIAYRYLDENVNTMLYGFMQPGNKRLSFESRHKIASFLKIGTHYRLEEGLNKAKGIKLNNIGVSTNGALGKNLAYAANLTTVQSQIKNGEVLQINWNYLINSSLQFYNNWEKFRGMASLNYNDFLLYDSTSLSRFSQVGINGTVQQNNWSIVLGYDYFYQNNKNFKEGTNMLTLKGGVRFEKGVIEVGIKYAIRENNNSVGWHFHTTYELSRFLDLTLSAEKFVLGNFYRNYYQTAYNQFPYLLKMGLKVKI